MPDTPNPNAQTAVDPALRRQCDSILNAWKGGKTPHQTALDTLSTLSQEAHLAGRIGDEGYAEVVTGILQGWRGNFTISIQHFEKARDLFVRANNREQVVRCTLNIGESYRQKGSFTRARQYFNTAYRAAKEMEHIPLQATSRLNEALMLLSVDHADPARTALLEAYAMTDGIWQLGGDEANDDIRRKGVRGEVCHSLATLALRDGDSAAAWVYAEEALSLGQALEMPLRLGMAYRVIGQIVTALDAPPGPGYSDNPDEYFQTAMEHFRAISADGEIARTLYAQGLSLQERGRTTLAARRIQQAIVIFSRLGMVDDAARAADVQLKML